MMSIDDNIASLTTATTNLLYAVNVSKATLDASVASAQTVVTNAVNVQVPAAVTTSVATAVLSASVPLQAYVNQGSTSAAIQNVMATLPTVLPYEVTAITGGVGTGTGGTPGEYALGVTSGPLGHQAFVTIDSTGKIVSYRNANPGISATNTAPTYSLSGVTGLTGATVPTATVGTIPVNRVFYAPSTDFTQLLAFGNNAGVLATAPFGGTQISVPTSSAINSYAKNIGVKDAFPDTFFREIDNTFFYRKTGVGPQRVRFYNPTICTFVDGISPYTGGRSLSHAANAGVYGPVFYMDEAGGNVGDTFCWGIKASGISGRIATNAQWFGPSGTIGSQFSWGPGQVTLTPTVTTMIGSSVRPAGATLLRILISDITSSPSPTTHYLHAVWGQNVPLTSFPSDPVYQLTLPTNILERVRNLEARSTGVEGTNIMLRRVSYTALTSLGAITNGGQTGTNDFYVGWGCRMTPIGSFNAVRIPGVTRSANAVVWSTLNVIVRVADTVASGDLGGTVLAVGHIDLDPTVLTYGTLIIPLRDPKTGLFKTLNNSDLGTEYFVGYYGESKDGTVSPVSNCTGTQTGGVTVTNGNSYKLQNNTSSDPLSAWQQLANSTTAIEHLLLTSPTDSFDISNNMLTKMVAILPSDAKAAWAVSQTYQYDSLTPVISAGGTNSGTYPNGYSGYGTRLSPIAGTSFNAIQIPTLNRISTASPVPTTINIVVRAGTSGTTWGTGTILAVGSAPVDPTTLDYSGIVVPLVDPTTGAFKTIAATDLGSEYCVAVYARSAAGTNAQLNPPGGALPNQLVANDCYQLVGNTDPLTGVWYHSSPGAAPPLNHVLIVNPRLGYSPSVSLKAALTTTPPGTIISLPPKLYGVVGREMNVYLDSLMLARREDVIMRVSFSSASVFYGQHQDERWTFTPTTTLSAIPMTITTYDKSTGAIIGSANTTLNVAPAATSTTTIKYLAIGDSTTAFATSPNQELSNLQAADANLKLTFLGTRNTGGVAHEAASGVPSSGWAAAATVNGTTNGFYNPTTKVFDYQYYLTNSGQPQADDISWHLGINDLGSADDDTSAAGVGFNVGSNIEAMITSVHSVSASIKCLVFVTIPPSLHEDGMISASNLAYSGRAPTARQRRNQILVAKALIARFSGRESSQIYVVPVNLAVDTERGWPYLAAANANSRSTIQVTRVSDAIHFNGGTGVLQYADAAWAALKNLHT